MATIHHIEDRRQERLNSKFYADYLPQLWDRYDEVMEHLQLMPTWMVLRVMTGCRRKLKDRTG